MVPFFVLVVSCVLFRLAGMAGVPYFDSWQESLAGAVALMFLVTASAHWGKRRADLIRMVPPGFPRPAWIVTVTGWLEIAGAVGLLIPATSRFASIGLAILLVVMFPANIYAARRQLTLGGKPVTPLIPRTVLQILFIAAVITAGFTR